MGLLRLAALGSLAAAYAGIALLFERKAPDQYMDEIFHVPQAQAYCRGEWAHWDDKITTLPGAYLVAVAHAGAVSAARRALGMAAAAGSGEKEEEE